MKRFLAFIILAAMFLGTMPTGTSFAEPLTDGDYASIEFGTLYTLHNVKRYLFEQSGDVAHLVRDGRECIRFRYEAPRISFCYIDADDSVFKPGEKRKVKVYVDYFDEGYGRFSLRYCSPENAWTDWADVVKCENTQTWKTHQFILKDADFSGKCNGYDIVLAQWSQQMSRSEEDVIFGGIRIEKTDKEPIAVEFDSAEYGNIFAPGEELLINALVTNNTNQDKNVQLAYRIYDHKGEPAEEKTEIKKIGTNGGTIEIRPAVTEFGTYTLKGALSYTDEDGTSFSQEVEQYFSIADKFAPGERKNEDFGVCSHWNMFPTEEEVQRHQVTLSELGAGWDRSEIQWSLVEKAIGSYEFPSYAECPKLSYSRNIDTLLILDYGNVLYPDSGGMENAMPGTPEYLQAYANYCVKMLDYYDGIIKYVEVWNEVNNAEFNVKGDGIEVYANLLKTVVPIIKQAHPEVKIIGPVTINATAEWFRELFNYGVYDLLDCISTHPYQWNNTLEKDVMRKEIKDIIDVCKEFGEPKPIWISEMGWSIGLDASWAVKAEERPTHAFQMYNILKGEGLADKIIWYNFHNKGNNIYESTYNLGLVKHTNNSVTPWAADDLYVLFAALNKKLGNAEPVKFIRREDETCLYWYKRPDGKSVMTAWAEDTVKNVSMYLGCTSLDKYDMYGNKLATLTSKDGCFLIAAETEPVYYEGDFHSFEERENDLKLMSDTLAVGLGEEVTVSAIEKNGSKVTIEAESTLEQVGTGTERVTLKTLADHLEEYPVTVKVFVDGSLRYHGLMTVRTSAVKTELKVVPTNGNYSKAILTVQNNAVYTPVSGNVQLSIEGRTEPLNKPIRFVEIPPGESRSFEMSLPEITKKRHINLVTEVAMDIGFRYSECETVDLNTFTYTDNPPVIDGRITPGEWSGRWFACDTADSVKQINNWGGVNDSSFCGQLLWDEEKLYMTVVAKDNVFCQPYVDGNVWQGDGLQFAFCDYTHPKTLVTECTAIAISHTEKGDQIFRSAAEYSGDRGIIETAEVKAERVNDGIVYEAAIPWKEIFYDGYVPKTGEYIGFSILMNDNDGGGRRGWLEYNSGIGTGRNYTMFGRTVVSK